jgi:hypothetical protein
MIAPLISPPDQIAARNRSATLRTGHAGCCAGLFSLGSHVPPSWARGTEQANPQIKRASKPCCRHVPVPRWDCLALSIHVPAHHRRLAAGTCGKHPGSGANAEAACFDWPSRMKHGSCSPDSPESAARRSSHRARCSGAQTLHRALDVAERLLLQPVFSQPSLIGPVRSMAGNMHLSGGVFFSIPASSAPSSRSLVVGTVQTGGQVMATAWAEDRRRGPSSTSCSTQ